MIWFIDDYNQYEIEITDTVRSWRIPKFRITMEVEEPNLYLRWNDREKGSGGDERLLVIDYQDVVDGYSGYIDNPASATALMAQIDAMIVSGFGLTGDVLTAKADLLSHDGVSDTILPGGTNEDILSRDNSTQTGLNWIAKTDIYSDEMAQDAVGNNVGAGLDYNDTTGSIYANLAILSKSADYTLALADASTFIETNTTTSLAITIPTNATVAFPIGTTIAVGTNNTGMTFFSPAVGVTTVSLNNYLGILASGGVVRLTKTDTDEWYIDGDLRSALDPDTEAYILAVEALGGGYTSSEERYINTFVESMKATGSLWTKTHYCHIYVGGTETNIKLNLVDPVDADLSHRLEFTGSPTINANGITFNGTTNYANLNYNPSVSSAGQNDKCYAFYFRSAGGNVNFGAVNGAINGDEIAVNAGLVYWSIGTGFDTRSVPSPYAGFWLMNRTASTTIDLRRNDVSLDSYATATSTNINLDLYLGCRNGNGTPAGHSADNLCFDWGGASLSSAEATALYNACVTLQTSLGRNV